MIEILLSLVILLGAAKRGRRRRYPRNFAVIPFTADITLGTLANVTVTSVGALTANFTEDIWIMSVKATWTLIGSTTGEGPITVGVAHGDYGVAEIKECLEAELTGPVDQIAQERSRRKVRESGTFPAFVTNEQLADGRLLKTKCNFLQSDGKNLSIWAYNRSGASLTTGATVRVTGKIFGQWKI